MAQATTAIIEAIRRYVRALEEHGIHVDDAFLFGSFAKGTARDESDIDVALISEAFSGDRFDDHRCIVPLRRAIDNRLEPMPFRPEGFADGGIWWTRSREMGFGLSCES